MSATSNPAAAEPPLAAAGRQRSITSSLFGLFLILAGTLFTLSNFELLPFQPTLLDLLPILFGIVACDRLLAGRPSRALIWLGLGAVLAYGLFNQSFELKKMLQLWPLIPVLIGLNIVLKALGLLGPGPTGRQGELAFFGSLRSRVADQAYSGGSCIAVLGGHRIDLREARLHENGATLQVFAMWGGIGITVPPGWSVSTQVFCAFGGADDKTRPPHSVPAGLPRLVVRGVVLMGGLEVRN
jgi:hypothetical protein